MPSSSSQRIACIGGGQLAQMIGAAAIGLGIKVRSAGAPGSCAFETCEPFTNDLTNEESVSQFLEDVDVFTFESEHEGLDFVDHVVAHNIPIYPSADFVRIAGDRLLEKTELDRLGIPVAPFVEIPTEEDERALALWLKNLISSVELSDSGVVVKTRRGGYDGKGQWVLPINAPAVAIAQAAQEIFPLLSTPGCIIEGLVNFSLECSILASRSRTGEMCTWPLTHSVHRDSILRISHSPITTINNVEELQAQALEIVSVLCEEHNYVGTIAVECFVTPDGLVVNEIAPRVHNSGHWTIEGAVTSQFEQHVRAVTGLPLGSTEVQGFSAMINLIGTDVDRNAIAACENTHLHWYGKEIRPARKVGHITIVASSPGELETQVNKVLEIMGESSV